MICQSKVDSASFERRRVPFRKRNVYEKERTMRHRPQNMTNMPDFFSSSHVFITILTKNVSPPFGSTTVNNSVLTMC